jgi:predicted AAA+ superfamily ATPase
MAISNQERVGKALELLRTGLGPFVEREIQAAVAAGSLSLEGVRRFAENPILGQKPIVAWDVAAHLKIMWETWNDVFARTLGRAERSLVQEIRDWRNKWAHQEAFPSRDAERAMDSMVRLLQAIAAPEAEEIDRIMLELRRVTLEQQVRGEKRKAGGSLIEPASAANLKPWREVITPHPDVATGRYQQAEFAADLWQVHLGQGSDEYRKPVEFFRRTFLTESLKRLLVGGVQRLSGKGGDPVIQLQTNFGGGKTHSMLALYHLFGGARPGELAGVDTLLAEADVQTLPKANRVVLVGNKISPGNPVTKPDGTVVRTLWGEMAWQLGGAKAYARIAKDDESGTSPGDMLRELFVEYGPCLILIDEWVAYARQLHDQGSLPAGNFETQFSFAQALTESAKLADNCLLVVSLPASDTSGSPHAQANDVEVGGIRGREALDRLRNVVGRLESSWRPASAEEGFEIVRRRLFEQIPGELYKQRDITARAFVDLYRDQKSEFPPGCADPDYEKRIQAAYPIHPEIFDRLYTDWSTLVKFQRTRGVLRLMAAVIHSLWEKGDRSPLILPSTIPIDDPRVQFELTRYLSDNWAPIIEKDVDGSNSLPLRIDGEMPNLGKISATRRVARTIYLGSAPTTGAAHQGLEDRQVKLGCVMPGESSAIFGDALRYLASSATYLFQDGNRAWYSVKPTVTKLADDRAALLLREPDKVEAELEQRIKNDLKQMGDFSRIYPMPRSNADVPDDFEARLVILPREHAYSREAGNAAEVAAKAILEQRGNTPRLYRNTLVFLAADKVRLPDLEESIRRYLAWSSIVAEKEILNLDPQQQKQAADQQKTAEGAIVARMPEAYQWLLVPEQATPQVEVKWQAIRLTGSDPLAIRASKKLRIEELLVGGLAPSILRRHLDAVPLWSGNHIPIRQLVAYFAQYLYLPRLIGPQVLMEAIRNGVDLLTWQQDSFAYADSFDDATSRYLGLRGGQHVSPSAESSALLVKPEVAGRQLAAEVPTTGQEPRGETPAQPAPGVPPLAGQPGQTPRVMKRFHGSVALDPARVGRDAGRIAEEIVAHLVGQVGAEVTVILDIEVQLPNGATDQLIRTVTENSRTLKFKTHGFEDS